MPGKKGVFMRSRTRLVRPARALLAIAIAVAVSVVGAATAQAVTVSVGDIAQLNANGTPNTTTFNPAGAGFNGPVYALAQQSDGKYVVGGNFNGYNGTAVGRGIIRLNADGSLDTAFEANVTSTGLDSYVWALKIQSDGKIVIGGQFTTYNGTTVNHLARLNADGTLDTTFQTNLGTGPNGNVLSLAIQPDGSIVFGGAYTQFNSVSGIRSIARVDSTGTLQSAFTSAGGSGFNGGYVYSISLQSDGKIVLGGMSITTFNATNVGLLMRLNADGSLDTSFPSSTFTGNSTAAVYSTAIQSDGSILAAGNFTGFAGSSTGVVPNIGRVSSAGVLDTSFSSAIGGVGPNNYIRAVAYQPSDGSIVLGGPFTQFNGAAAGNIVRLSSAGAPDTVFNGAAGGFNNAIYAISLDTAGTITVGGTFYQFISPSVVTFNANGGTGSMSPQVGTSSAALSANTFTRNGYTFSRWNTQANGSGTNYSSTATYTFATSTTLYAQWAPINYSINWYFNGGSGTYGPSTYTTDTSFALPGSPTRSGFTFNGWKITGTTATTTTLSPTATTATVTGYGAVTLTAQWIGQTLAVNYDTQGGSAVASGTFQAGGSITLPALPTQAGYTSTGWFAAASGGSALSSPYSPSGTSAITLYAQWTANSYSISSNVSQPGGTPGASSYTTGQPFTLPSAPTQTGYVFNGWLITGPNISTVTTLPSATTATVVGYGPLTLTVQWLAVTPPTSSGSGSSGTGTAGTGSPGSGGSSSAASGLSAGGLATTGVDLRSVLLGALTLLGIGTLLRMVSIRRDA